MQDGLRCEVVSLGACLEDEQIPGDPEYLYHVTSAPNAARIALMGFKRSPPMFAHGVYSDPLYTVSDSAFVSRLHLAQHDGVILAQREDAPMEYMVTRAEQIRICGETYVALPECGRKTVGLAL